MAASMACGAPATPEGAPAAGATPEPAEAKAAPVPRELPAVVARVNDEAVERWELEAALREITLANLHPIPQAQRDEIVRMLLDRIIEHHLAAQMARARKVGVSDAELDEDLREMRRQYPDDRAFEDILASFGVSRDQLRYQRRLSLDVAKLVSTAIEPAVSVSDADVSAYYRDNPARFQLPETVTASHILIGVSPDATAAQKAEARRRATELLDQIRGGADFARLAQAHSEDQGSAAAGGLLGAVPRGRMDAAFDAAAFSVKPGELSDIVETPYGFHIIKVEEHQDGRTMPLAEVRGDIRKLLEERGRQDGLAALIQEAKRTAKIEILI
jgi:peptidyl-prolyl cis-trans isomerase C